MKKNNCISMVGNEPGLRGAVPAKSRYIEPLLAYTIVLGGSCHLGEILVTLVSPRWVRPVAELTLVTIRDFVEGDDVYGEKQLQGTTGWA